MRHPEGVATESTTNPQIVNLHPCWKSATLRGFLAAVPTCCQPRRRRGRAGSAVGAAGQLQCDEAGASRAIAYYRSIPRSLLVPHRRLLETYRVAFSRITVPALVLSGDRDGCIGCEIHSGIEAAFTAPVRSEVVRGAGHFLPLEATDPVAELAIPFVRG